MKNDLKYFLSMLWTPTGLNDNTRYKIDDYDGDYNNTYKNEIEDKNLIWTKANNKKKFTDKN